MSLGSTMEAYIYRHPEAKDVIFTLDDELSLNPINPTVHVLRNMTIAYTGQIGMDIKRLTILSVIATINCMRERWMELGILLVGLSTLIFCIFLLVTSEKSTGEKGTDVE